MCFEPKLKPKAISRVLEQNSEKKRYKILMRKSYQDKDEHLIHQIMNLFFLSSK